jgi:hypothetical protein
MLCKKGSPITMPGQALRVEAARFQDDRHMKVVRLSAVRTGHLYWYSFLLKAESTPGP